MSDYEHIFDPTTRVKNAVAAFKYVGDGIRTKGFLGPSLQENNSYPSVGISAARRSGVIVDDAGKMRCPAGTPNANQFTDISMSNCMVPSAETVAQQAADAAVELSKKTVDGFKRSSFSKKQKSRDSVPNAGVGFANTDGFLEQRKVVKGNGVSSPIDGSQRELNSVSDSVKHLSEGGALSDIPDEHLVRAIEGNPDRFEVIGTGGGVHGMKRMRDKKTRALIGIKYADSSPKSSEEALREIASEIVLEHMGYEPTPMRAVPNINDSNGSESWNGIALVTELAHNRNQGEIEGARITDRKGELYDYNVDPVDIIRMTILDSILQNTDRHEGNFMIARGESGNGAVVPIDHSLGFQSDDDVRLDFMVKIPWPAGLEAELMPYYVATDKTQLVEDVSGVQETLRNIDIEKMQEQISQLYSHFGSMGGAPSQKQKDSISKGIERIGILADAENKWTIAEQIIPEHRAEYYRTINEWANKPEPEDPFASPPSTSWGDIA